LLNAGGPAQEEPGLIADLLGVPSDGRYPRLDLSPQLRRAHMLAALVRWIEALASARPLLWVVEDAHWADPTTLELLDMIAARADSLPLLLVVIYRPEFHAPWAGQAYVTELRLSRLGRRENTALIKQVAGGPRTLPPDVIENIVERSDGVPLFIEELTRATLEASGDANPQAASPASAMVPATLHASLTARLDRLGCGVRQMTQAAAAIGREFGHDLLAAIADLPDDALGLALRQLEGAELIHRRGVAPEATYSFRHVLLRDAAYGMLLREPRRMLHARIAEAIVRLRPDAADHEPQLAGLALCRGRPGGAGDWVLAAGGRAERRAVRQPRGCRLLRASA
jgi:predicted ATPase